MLKYIVKHYKGYLLGFFCLTITNLLGAYIPQLIKQAIDMLSSLDSDALFKLLLWATLMAVLMALIRTASRQIIFARGREIEFDLKKDIFNHLVTLPPSYFANKQEGLVSTQAGSLISVITNDVQSLRMLGGFAMLNVFNTLVAFAITLPLMFQLHEKLTWAFLTLIPIVVFFVIALSSKIKTYQTWVQEELAKVSEFIEQNLSGIHIIKAYAQEAAELKRFEGFNNGLRDAYMKLIQVRSFIGPVMRVIASLGFVLLLYIGGQAIIEQEFSAGDFAAYTLYIQRLIWPIATLGWLITLVYRGQVSQARINSILDVDPSIKDRENAIEKNSFDSKIELKTLARTINKGEKVAIVGRIGSGKTILANKLMHLKELEDGEIFIDGVDLKDIKLDSLRSLINIVPQNNFLFSNSIAENIAYARELEPEQIEELAKLVCIHDEITALPEGYQSIVGERGVTLSGGQRQRIAIARALAVDPEVLILDDSLSSLDEISARNVLCNILKQRQGKTTIFVGHNQVLLEHMDQVIELEAVDG
ncbi:MAG: ABC transporter ATP-binding protein [Candidatus Melainabacteria bacterium]|nr:ABC transporter ATP-binding protein [Candidatus Melainabacteria bacterium]